MHESSIILTGLASLALLVTAPPAEAHVIIDMPPPPSGEGPTSAAEGADSANIDLGDIAFMRYTSMRTGTHGTWGFGGGAGWGRGWGRGGGWRRGWGGGWGCGGYSPFAGSYSPWGGGWGGWNGWGGLSAGYYHFTTPQSYYGSRFYGFGGPRLVPWW